jgi:hypothetical protein
MYVERHELTLTTDSSGAATGYIGPVTGRVLQVRYVPHASTPLDTNADVTISGEASGVNVLTKANIGTAAFTVAPRQATHAAADGAAALYAAGGAAVNDCVVVAGERLKVVVAQGADTKTGTVHVWVG